MYSPPNYHVCFFNFIFKCIFMYILQMQCYYLVYMLVCDREQELSENCSDTS